MIYLKTKQEIDAMRESGQKVAQVLSELSLLAVPGATTKGLDLYAEARCKELHCTPAFKGYKGFPGCVCISVNEECIHGIPSDRKLLEGDIVGLDFGVVYNGWYGDSARTIKVGKVSSQAEHLLTVTQQALNYGIGMCCEGKTTGDIGAAIQGYAEMWGFGVVKEFTGHGIGRALHEDPSVLNYGKVGEGFPLKVGMVLAIEPIITYGSPEIKTLKDGWTVSTRDGSLAAHFEHTIAITENGPEILTRY